MIPAEVAARYAVNNAVDYGTAVRCLRSGLTDFASILAPPSASEAQDLAKRYPFSFAEIYGAWTSERSRLRESGRE